MTKDFSDDPIEGEEARAFRKMHNQWETHLREDLPNLRKVSWVIRNFKLVVAFIALGAFTNVREIIMKVMGGEL